MNESEEMIKKFEDKKRLMLLEHELIERKASKTFNEVQMNNLQEYNDLLEKQIKEMKKMVK